MQRTRDSIADVFGERTPYRGEGKWPARVDVQLEEEPDRWVQSCCALCSSGCACDIAVKGDRIVGVRGRAVDRVNKGRLGPKGLHGWIAGKAPDRLTRPLVRTGKKQPEDSLHPVGEAFRPATWDEAMDLVVRRAREVIEQYTGDAIGFYNSGQLFLEDYYTLSLMAHVGVRTSNIDGNTRLCTATAAMSLQNSFGSDGQPGTYADIDTTDCLLIAGHDPASSQTVMWMRILDRLHGPDRPKLVVCDPRSTRTAQEADVHLANRLGTNVALCNGLIRQLIRKGYVEERFVAEHTVGFAELAARVEPYTLERTAQITQVPAVRLEQAAELIGTAPSLLSVVLQGFYQSHQATAAAVQINNIHLLRGMIGRPGCGILQSNGQPTAQNTRETGCDSDFAGFRNWQNPEHMAELARLWNVEPERIPHWSNKIDVMEMLRRAELRSLRMLWIIGTNPAVSLPELHRVREILASPGLFVVVQDGYMTETARLADVVLPAALWGEKTGTFTNSDRTVHLSRKAVEPPGEARADMDVFLDFSRRMGFRDKDGQPLIKWTTPEECFEAWKACTRGRFCDYTGITYARLAEGSGIQWPCNEEDAPRGTPRLYADGVFETAADDCQTFGHDLETGALRTAQEYRASDPRGRAILKAADYRAPLEEPDDTYPFWLTTGRLVYHFRTRTRTGRSPALQEAAGEAFVEIDEQDAARLGIRDGQLVEVSSRRGSVELQARVLGPGGILPGHLFIPFHYGYWDDTEGRLRAANELTLTAWDPVSKQPLFKCAAAAVRLPGQGPLRRAHSELFQQALRRSKEAADKALSSLHRDRAHVADYLGMLSQAHEELAGACRTVAGQHLQEPMVQDGLHTLASLSEQCLEGLRPFMDRYRALPAKELPPGKLQQVLFPTARTGSFGLLRDLHALLVLASEVEVSTLVVMQAARVLGDEALLAACTASKEQVARQKAWLVTHLQHRAPHTLVVPQ